MLSICAGLPRSNSLQMFNWMIHIAESDRDCHFYNARYLDFYDHPTYGQGDSDQRFARVLDVLRSKTMTHVLFKSHACPRRVFDMAQPHDKVTAVFTIRNIHDAIASLLHLWCNWQISDDEIISKCTYQMRMNLVSLAEIHDSCHILVFNDMLADRRGAIMQVAKWMEIELTDQACDYIMTRTSKQSIESLYAQLPHMWWETYHDMMNVHLSKNPERFAALSHRIQEILDALQPELRAVKSNTGLDLEIL